MRFAILIVQPPGYPHSAAFFELAEWLRSALRRLDQDVIIAPEPVSDRRNIVIGWHLLPPTIALRGDSILLNTEQLYHGSPYVNDAMLALFWRFEVWDYSQKNASHYRELQLPNPKLISLGYAAELDRIMPQTEDIDVLFYGSIDDHRRRVLWECQNAGLNVVHLFGVYGSKRDEYIARSKLVLNMHQHVAEIFEIVRVAYLLNNRRCIVSERGSEPAIEDEFEGGIAFASYYELVATCKALCADAGQRQQIARVGYEQLARRDLSLLANAIASDAPTSMARYRMRSRLNNDDEGPVTPRSVE